ncbi:MAG TPA: hypothetical protein VGC36_10795, partial [Rhizomicrobium sp.]
MTSVAANTDVNNARAASGGVTPAATDGGDAFAAMLGDVLQAATPGRDAVADATPPVDAAPATDAAAPAQTPTATALSLQELPPPDDLPADDAAAFPTTAAPVTGRDMAAARPLRRAGDDTARARPEPG